MKGLRFLLILASLWALTVLYSCAALKPINSVPSLPSPPPSPPPAAPAEKKPVTGMKGSVALVDANGEAITYQSGASAVVSVKLMRDGKPAEGKTSSFNPEEDGSFFISLKEGVYFVEVFLKGFHVESFTINVDKNEVFDVGTVIVRKFEAGGGKPVKGGKQDELPPNEGDVNIQPPVS
jgi:hypothetical protein